jgi:hypothetical protein
MHQAHHTTKATKRGVSNPELVHARNVRLKSVYAKVNEAATAAQAPDLPSSDNLSAHHRVKAAHTNPIRGADCGGINPVRDQTASRRIIHKKLEYPSTGRNGGGFHVYPNPRRLSATYRNVMYASSQMKWNSAQPTRRRMSDRINIHSLRFSFSPVVGEHRASESDSVAEFGKRVSNFIEVCSEFEGTAGGWESISLLWVQKSLSAGLRRWYPAG